MVFKSEDYIHPADQAALASLQAIPGFSRLLKMFMKQWSERLGRIRSMSSYVRIDENQLPEYKEMLIPVCEKLGIDVPELYLMNDVRPNAFTFGENQPYIVITSGLLQVLPKELIPTVLAHECGHIACHHVLYRTMGTILITGAFGSLGRLPLGSLISLPLQVAFFYWMRCSEYSADRAAVLCDGTPAKMAEVCMRLSGFDRRISGEMNLDAFLEQAREYRETTNDSAWDKTLEFSMLANASHPLTALRALECTEWAETDQYQQILAGTYVAPAKADESVFKDAPAREEGILCPDCGTLNRTGALYCRSCGRKLDAPRICPDCGEMLDGSETFCPGCGKKL